MPNFLDVTVAGGWIAMVPLVISLLLIVPFIFSGLERPYTKIWELRSIHE